MLYIQKRNMLKEIGFTVQTGTLLVFPRQNCQLHKREEEGDIGKEDISGNGSAVDICPTEKSSQMELLKLIFFQLPAL